MKGIRIAAAVVLSACLLAPAAASAKDQTTSVRLLAINDFHGNLQPPTGSSGRINGPGGAPVLAGGVEYLGTWMDRLRAGHPNAITVGGGDLIGASPLISGLFHDEPAIEAMNALHLDVTSVGNHEFDEGPAELLRMQNGGCHPIDGCQDGDPFTGAAFQYLSANVFRQDTGRTLLPPYQIRRIGPTRIKLAFIGLTLKGTPLIVTPSGVAGLDFRDEVQTVNGLVRRLRENDGVRAFVVLIHQGGQQNAPFANGFMDINRCDNFTGEIKPIVDALDPAVDAVVSAHTHQPYVCHFNGIVTTSAASFGRLITSIDLTLDDRTRDVVSATAENHIVSRDVAKDPAETKIINKYDAISAPIANRVVGSITADIPGRDASSANFAQETKLGDVIADAQLASTAPTDFGGAVVAFMNPGGIRADLVRDNQTGGEALGEITYSELFNVQPFSNVMEVKTMTGDMIYRLLAQQFNNPTAGALRVLQVSKGFTYQYRFDGSVGSVVDGSVKINGVPVDRNASYRVAMNNFLADGGDGFGVFKEGTDQLGGQIDLDALVDYFEHNSPVAPGPQDRIVRLP